MNKLYKVEDIVYQVLKEVPEARKDDFVLVAEVYNRIQPLINNVSFNRVMLAHKELGLPYFESISRARRRLQSIFEELRPSQEVQEARDEEQLVYREYAR